MAWLTLFTQNNHHYEPDAVVTATVDGSGSYYILNSAGSARVTVSDDDLPDMAVELEAPAEVDETVGEITVRVRASTVRDEAPHRHVTVRLSSADRTAVSGPGGDFDSIDESLRFLDRALRTHRGGREGHVRRHRRAAGPHSRRTRCWRRTRPSRCG